MNAERPERREAYHFQEPPQRSLDEAVAEILTNLPEDIVEEEKQLIRLAVVLKRHTASIEREDPKREKLSEIIGEWRQKNPEVVDALLYKILIGGFESSTHGELSVDTDDGSVRQLLQKLAIESLI